MSKKIAETTLKKQVGKRKQPAELKDDQLDKVGGGIRAEGLNNKYPENFLNNKYPENM